MYVIFAPEVVIVADVQLSDTITENVTYADVYIEILPVTLIRYVLTLVLLEVLIEI